MMKKDMIKKVTTIVLIVVMLFTGVFGNAFGDVAYAESSTKKEKFIIKHADNEKLREKFFPTVDVEEEIQEVILEESQDVPLEEVNEEVEDEVLETVTEVNNEMWSYVKKKDKLNSNVLRYFFN